MVASRVRFAITVDAVLTTAGAGGDADFFPAQASVAAQKASQ